MRFRRAKPDDLDRLVAIHLAAYPDPRSVAARERNFTDHPFGSMEDLVVAEHDGAVVAHAFLLPMRAWFGGRSVPVGGIASVGVAPDARGRGVATALMRHLHRVSERRGDALTMLYAFRQGFYTRLGYATTSSRRRLSLDTRSVPTSWRELGARRVRAARPSDRTGIRDVHARRVARSSGWVTRPPAFWDRIVSRERLVPLVCDGDGSTGISGYVTFTLEQEHSHAVTVIEVDELVSDDAATRRALLGALGTLRDQASEIVLEVADDDPLERALVDPDGRRHGSDAAEHVLGELVGGPMLRIVDVGRAIEARGWAEDGSFDVVVTEAARGRTLAVGGVRVRAGRARLGPSRGGAPLTTSRAGLAAILYGGLTTTDAVALGLAEAGPRLAAHLDAMARMPPLDPIDAF